MTQGYVHPDARVETATIGARTRVWAFAHILDGAVIGADCNIGDAAFIEGGARIGDRVTVKNAALIWNGVHLADDVFVGPRVTFTNDRNPRSMSGRPESEWLTATYVDQGASLGANATIVAGSRIGAYALVAAGAVVTRDVPPHALVAGNPARIIGWVAHSGQRLDRALAGPNGEQYAFRSPGDLSGGLELFRAAEDVAPARSY
jgi:acetyltransferase-like isoleucine patch superfamily enzyme